MSTPPDETAEPGKNEPSNYRWVPDLVGQDILSPTEPNDRSHVTLTADIHSGPLPSAHEFRAYKDAHEPAAQWILDQGAANAVHVRAMEAIAIRAQSRDILLARLLPFAVMAMFIGASLILAAYNVWIGTVAFFSTFSSVVIAYLQASKRSPLHPSPSPSDTSPEQRIPTRAPPPPHD